MPVLKRTGAKRAPCRTWFSNIQSGCWFELHIWSTQSNIRKCQFTPKVLFQSMFSQFLLVLLCNTKCSTAAILSPHCGIYPLVFQHNIEEVWNYPTALKINLLPFTQSCTFVQILSHISLLTLFAW